MTDKIRLEHDLLGDMMVPADAYYGVQTMRAIEDFPITGLKIDRALIMAMAIVKKAAAHANMDVGLLPEDKALAIMDAATEIIEHIDLHKWFVVDPIQGGAGTSINMNTNEVIANRALELLGEEKGNYKVISPNTHVNMSQSTNDAFPCGLHLAAIIRLDMLIGNLEKLIESFENKAKEFGNAIKMGRTHLQDAVPIRFSQEFLAYAAVLKRDLVRIKKVQENLYGVNMGATAVGTGLNADPAYIEAVGRYLALYSRKPVYIVENLVDGTQNTDAYTETSSTLKICMLNLSKIANDLRLMASGPRCGLGELKLPACQPGSSILPGKVNPVMAEVVNQIAFQVTGNDLTISMASEAGQFELNVMEPVLTFNLLQSINIMTNVLHVFKIHCIDGITINAERGREYVEKSVGTITAINPYIGYEQASQIANEAIITGRPVRELVKERGILTDEEMEIILNPENMTTPGISGAEVLGDKFHLKQSQVDGKKTIPEELKAEDAYKSLAALLRENELLAGRGIAGAGW